jgi:hypothetical protein
MPLRLASNLLFDSDQENLFEVADIPNNTLWVSARVYNPSEEDLQGMRYGSMSGILY